MEQVPPLSQEESVTKDRSKVWIRRARWMKQALTFGMVGILGATLLTVLESIGQVSPASLAAIVLLIVVIVGCVVGSVGGLVCVIGCFWVLAKAPQEAHADAKKGVPLGLGLLALCGFILFAVIWTAKDIYRREDEMRDMTLAQSFANELCAYTFRAHPSNALLMERVLGHRRQMNEVCFSRFHESDGGLISNAATCDFVCATGQNEGLVFVNPEVEHYRRVGYVPVAFWSRNYEFKTKVRLMPILELEAQLRRQTGMGMADIVRSQRETNRPPDKNTGP